MSERKVLNKYYPPDFDPSNIPKMKTQKNRPFNIRIMAPMNMRCDNCGEYIYKGKKFNSRKEDVEDEFFLGLRIFRFYIKCPRCVSEIAFKTDLENTDYTLEAGATRLFEAEKLARQMAEKEIKDKEEEELNNPMKVLENRTKASRKEIEEIDTLEELRDMNARHAKVDHEDMLKFHAEYEKQLKRLQEEEEEKEIRAVFGELNGQSIKRLHDEDNEGPPAKKGPVNAVRATDILTLDEEGTSKQSTSKTTKPAVWERSIGSVGSKASLMKLVKSNRKKGNIVTRNTSESSQKGDNSAESKQEKGIGETSDCGQRLGGESEGEKRVTGHTEEKKNLKDSTTSSGSSQTGSTSALSMLGNYSDSEDSDT
ncbi:splicing factor YJU2-like [Saccostrea echinata]|uniref:splicing factor YJU2-like n=1 Tax=Saccostrea echinata TaxID=191078 RepID=UPI002A81310F|nr:splicing factor YJU2-like [Saccostrea echinata]